MKPRCEWCSNDPIYTDYHDYEWGVPLHDERRLFEMLILEGAQAGLSWITVLKKRPAYRELFHNFDVKKVAAMSDEDLEEILLNPAIIRNRLKVYSARRNAIAVLKLIEECGSLDHYFWSWIDHSPIVNHRKDLNEIPALIPLAETISKDLKKRGLNFVGPTIIYAYMQSIGMVDDHVEECFVRVKEKG
ncbi:DNA-3-methyladenine glycosylase I [Rubritalea profundi]|uniref:DNA-3-methyladenine glycosylase I n=1 Tax=Rubritalea profundi TaxID=1658618 RepID=A0A2S7U5I8_9BACT|nr:DNA-3-methyladenine glycosylase I [Rubritalea profundi]PQJ30286.1 DNA-3-methyladenine glycosylase [Rubritalea profundi]